MSEDDIEAVIEGFARCAKILVDAGFTGVQLHAAHECLLSQFLRSPRSNQRSDRWGGSLENRARLLLACVARVRVAVGPRIPISVKLNSADFQRGGFDFDESLQVAKWLEAASVDLIEISGGTYEQPPVLNLEGMEPVEAPVSRSFDASAKRILSDLRKPCVVRSISHSWSRGVTPARCNECGTRNRLCRYSRHRPAHVRYDRRAHSITQRARADFLVSRIPSHCCRGAQVSECRKAISNCRCVRHSVLVL